MNFASHLHSNHGYGNALTGWAISCLLHGSLAIGALLFIQRIQLAPEPEPFRWNVAMILPASVRESLSTSSPEPPIPRNEQTAFHHSPRASAPTALPETTQPSVTSLARAPVRQVESIPLSAPPREFPAPETVVETRSEAIGASLAVTPSPPTPALTDLPADAPILPPAHEPSLAALSAPAETIHTSPQPAQESSAQMTIPAPAAPARDVKRDYGWLADLMAKWVEDLEKRYPVSLRAEGVQGKVTLMAILHEDGKLSDVKVARSSGNDALDHVAVEDVLKGAPVMLLRPLERPQMPVKLSIIYDLRSPR